MKRKKELRSRDDPKEDPKRRLTQSTNKPLQGMVIAVTSAQQPADKIHENQEMNYKTIVDLCQTAGATVTSQVHKKVRCVLTTEAALDQATQRIRKAWNKGIPVLRVQWLQECIRINELVSMEGYRILENQVRQDASGDRKRPCVDGSIKGTLCKALETTSTSKQRDKKPSARVLDLGCCCSCHDIDNAADCPWCADCSINQAKG